MNDFKLACVLFDLDGTLVDTSPDLLASLDKALLAHGCAASDYNQVKPFISLGALAMINNSLPEADQTLKQQILTTMLDTYQANILEHSRFYPGIADTLALIEDLGLKWGVVTNKRERFTTPLIKALQLDARAHCVISGDTTAYPKPSPEPMYAACQQAQVTAEQCVYIGDAIHDIQAGKSANMKTLVALYGYLQADDQPENWGADGLIAHPEQLQQWIKSSHAIN